MSEERKVTVSGTVTTTAPKIVGRLTFLGFIEEEDGTMTAEARDEAGTVHEFRGCEITSTNIVSHGKNYSVEHGAKEVPMTWAVVKE